MYTPKDPDGLIAKAIVHLTPTPAGGSYNLYVLAETIRAGINDGDYVDYAPNGHRIKYRAGPEGKARFHIFLLDSDVPESILVRMVDAEEAECVAFLMYRAETLALQTNGGA